MIVLGELLLGLVVCFAIGTVIEAWCEARDARASPPPGEMIDIGGDRCLHLLRKGNAPGPTIVFEMGVIEPSPLWWEIQDAVACFAMTCSYDRAGYAWSPPAPAGRSMEDRASDLAKLLKAACVPCPYVLVGHSYGGALIELFARDNPADVAGLVFVDAAAAPSLFDPSFLAYTRSRIIPIMRVFGWAARCGLLRLFPTDAMLPDTLSATARRALKARQGPRLFASTIDDYRAMSDAAAGLGKKSMSHGHLGDRPVAVLTHGIPFPPPNDALEAHWGESQEYLAALSTDSELIIATQSNHMIQFDEPELVIDTIRRVHHAVRSGGKLAKR